MIDLYYWPTPNGNKITIMLEECGLDYIIHPINITAGDQFQPKFLKLSPNNRMPAIVDLAHFESVFASPKKKVTPPTGEPAILHSIPQW